VLEEEVTDLLGRGKSERRAAVDAPAGYRNGHGKTRRLSMMAGTIEVKRPRIRGLEERPRIAFSVICAEKPGQ
jgi:transposase-like protein